MATTEIVSKPPDIPSKWDVIPIHGSDVASYKRCKRYWDWTSPARNNLRRRVDIHGVNMPLFFGTGVHYALEMYYDPILRRDPVEAFLTWYQYQLDGGEVSEEWLDRTYDIQPKTVHDIISLDGGAGTEVTHYRIKGLKELLPNWEVVEEDFAFHRELGIGMLTFYKDWSERNDDFVTVAAESVYSIPLGFEAVDRREESPNYGRSLEVHARGKRDAVIYFPEFDKFGINDHKTAAIIGEDYAAKLEKDEQCSNYLWATIMESKQSDLPWSDKLVDRVLYTSLRKNYPHEPIMTDSTNVPSLDRTKQATTPELFQAAIVGNPRLEDWFRNTPKAQQFYTYLCEEGDSMFIQRDMVTRNKHEVMATGEHLRMVAREMLSDDLAIYPNPTNEFRCRQCAFRAPCLAKDDGSDWQGMLADGYEQNRDR